MTVRYSFALAAALSIIGGGAFALVTTDSVIQELSASGYTRIEVANGPTQMKVEAIRGTEKLEVVYDTATGNVLKSETDTVDADENTTPGVQVRTRDRDFVQVREQTQTGVSDDDDDEEDDDDDFSDDSDDDNSGSGSDDDDDDDDDHGGHGGHGGDDGGGDDHGGHGRGGDDD